MLGEPIEYSELSSGLSLYYWVSISKAGGALLAFFLSRPLISDGVRRIYLLDFLLAEIRKTKEYSSPWQVISPWLRDSQVSQ
jgi:hypothetical protein